MSAGHEPLGYYAKYNNLNYNYTLGNNYYTDDLKHNDLKHPAANGYYAQQSQNYYYNNNSQSLTEPTVDNSFTITNPVANDYFQELLKLTKSIEQNREKLKENIIEKKIEIVKPMKRMMDLED